jgi:phosphinothricin acetyltransferase
MENKVIRLVQEDDAEAICTIYNHYVAYTHFTFEENILPRHLIWERIRQVSKQFPWFVCDIDGEVVGYAYANHWKTRSAYRFTAESTIYLRHDYQGKGFGSELYQNLIGQLAKTGFHTVLASIALPNDISIQFHHKFGYREVGTIKEVGYKFDRQIDVAILQLVIL